MSIKEAIFRQVLAYSTKPDEDALFAIPGKQVAVYDVLAHNSFAGNNTVGIIKRFSFEAMQVWTDNSGVLSRVLTKPAIGSELTAWPLINDKILIGAKQPFGHIGLKQAGAAPGAASPHLTFRYWNGAAFVAFTAANTLEISDAPGAAAVSTAYPSPVQWKKGNGEASLSNDLYWIEIEAIKALGGVPLNKMIIGEFLSLRKLINQNGTLDVAAFGEKKPLVLDSDEALIPYFSDPDPLNFIEFAFNNTD